MQPERLFLGLNPIEWAAIGTMVNALVVAILAVINFVYMRSAARQARASERQAEATLEQARVADESLALLKTRMDQQSGLALGTSISALRQMRSEIFAWLPRLASSWGNLPDSCSLMPENWGFVQYEVRAQYPALKGQMDLLHQSILTATPTIQDIIATPSSARISKMHDMKVAASQLATAADALDSILKQIDRI